MYPYALSYSIMMLLFKASLLVGSLSLLLISSGVSATTKYTRVAFGEDVPPEEMPYFVTIVSTHFLFGPAICGGAIIGPGIILTAAHCVVDDYRDPFFDIYVKVKNETDAYIDADVSEFVIPDAYYPAIQPYSSEYYGDIALLRINPNITRHRIRLPKSPEDLEMAPILVGSGKGLTEGNKMSKQLEFVSVQRVSNLPNNSMLALEEDHFIAKDPRQNQDTCVGDSGGPLVVPNRYWNTSDREVIDNVRNLPPVDIQVGIVSYGEGQFECGDNNTYGVYTDVMYWKDWIDKQLTEDEEQGWTPATW